MDPGVPVVDAAGLAAWCTTHLGSAPATELFRSGHLSVVVGLRLADRREVVAVIGHCDWLAGDVRWRDDELLVVHDWDSAVADSEDVLVGFAAALYSTVSPDGLAMVEEAEHFLAAYRDARARALTAGEIRRAWAAGVWTRAYDAKYQHVAGHPITSLLEAEARTRLSRAGIEWRTRSSGRSMDTSPLSAGKVEDEPCPTDHRRIDHLPGR